MNGPLMVVETDALSALGNDSYKYSEVYIGIVRKDVEIMHKMVSKGTIGGMNFYQCSKCGASCIEEFLTRTQNENCEQTDVS